jgi:hypothetical protein
MSTCIRCSWQDEGKLVINPDGQVFPCCYLANKTYKADKHGALFDNVESQSEKGFGNWYWKEKSDKIMRDYVKHKDELNVKKVPMEDILNHPWYTEMLPESWENEETRNDICVTYCETPVEYDDRESGSS